jgi:4-amino-4-deoxy-L-arabinose transferase-like glycosyltransferase
MSIAMINFRKFQLWNHNRLPLSFLTVLALATLLAGVALVKAPFAAPTPVYLDVAEDVLRGRVIRSTFLPVGYVAFLVCFMKLGGLAGIFAGQAIAYVVTICLTYLILHRLRVSDTTSLLASSIVAMHPYLLLNIKRVIDHNVLIPLFLAFVLYTLRVTRRGASYADWLLLGIVSGAMVTVRPNCITLFVLPVAGCISRGRDVLRSLGVFLGAALIAVAAVTIPLTSRFFIFSDNGAYNFFARANDFAFDELINRYNAELAVQQAVKELGLPADPPLSVQRQGVDYLEQHPLFQPNMTALYIRWGMTYWREHPDRMLALTGLKVVNLFRPDYRQVYRSHVAPPIVIMIMQTLLALPALVWTLLRLSRWHRPLYNCTLNSAGVVGLAAVLYVLPFALTNSDPRFRLPLDLIFILDIACFLGARQSDTGTPKHVVTSTCTNLDSYVSCGSNGH